MTRPLPANTVVADEHMTSHRPTLRDALSEMEEERLDMTFELLWLRIWMLAGEFWRGGGQEQVVWCGHLDSLRSIPPVFVCACLVGDTTALP